MDVINVWSLTKIFLPFSRDVRCSLLNTDAATKGVLYKKVLIKISQHLEENICAIVCCLIHLLALEASFLKNSSFHRTPACFSIILLSLLVI